MATLVVWVLLDYFRTGRATAVGGATGIVVGLVAITPAAGLHQPDERPRCSAPSPRSRATSPSCGASRTRLDDSLDVFAGHGIGGITGALLTGVFASKVWNPAGNDGLLAGNPGQLGTQALGVVSSIVYAGVMTFVILKLLGLVTALRAAPRAEGLGIDVTQHGEEAYTNGEGSILVMPDAVAVGCAGSRPDPADRGALTPGGRLDMKLIVAIIRPDRLNEVLEALYRAEVRGLTVSRVLGHGGETDRVETYRGTTVKMELQEKVRLEIGVSEPFVDVTVKAILASARTGEVGDGKVFVLDVKQVHRIRTGERDEQAVTPTALVEA